jgi:hypothetical protein
MRSAMRQGREEALHSAWPESRSLLQRRTPVARRMIRRVTPQRLEIQVDRLVADSYLCSLSAAPASGIRLGKKTGQTV